jgi:glucosamine-6-phosphate deaminase
LPEEYESLIKGFLPIEVAFQGVGVNGHYGFNEPPSARNSHARFVWLHAETIQNNNIPYPKVQAKTLGLDIVSVTKHQLILIDGKHKKTAYQRLLKCKEFDPSFPVSILCDSENVEVHHTFK